MRILKVYIFLFILLLIFFQYENNVYSADERKNLILNNFIPNKIYNKFPNKNILKSILFGEWNSPPHSKLIFFNNGKFKIFYFEFNKIEKEGNWDVKNNDSIVIHLNDRNSTRVLEIEAIRLSTINSSYIEYKYTFEIVFKETEFWGGSLEYDFK